MRRFAVPHALGALAILMSLNGCGGDETKGNASALASLDTRLTNVAAQGNETAPAGASTAKGDAPAGRVNADGAAVRAAHESIIANDESVRGRSGEAGSGGANGAVRSLAAAQGKAVGGCAGRDLRYGNQWASAMPEGLGLYPGAKLVEAAGTDTGRCALRVVSFTTADSPQRVAAHYMTQVRAAGFDAERQPCPTEIRVGGTRKGDDAAYMLFARRTAKGLTEVDIIASAGPA